MYIRILSALAFWSVLVIGYRALHDLRDWLMKRFSYPKAMAGYCSALLVLTIVVIEVTEWHWVEPAKRDTKVIFYGAPIVSEVQNFEGKKFVPQAFVITSQHILVYDKDGRVYALDGIELDGIKPEQLTVASNVMYTVYQKGGRMLFGKL